MSAPDNQWFDALARARKIHGGADLLAESESAVQPHASVKPVEHPLPPYDARLPSIGIAGWSIILAVLALLVGAVVVAHRDLSAVSQRISSRDAAIAEEHRCAVPARDGDRVVLTVTNRGGQLVAHCLPVNDWRAPERMNR